MKRIPIIIEALLFAICCQGQMLPDALFAHITSDGIHIMLADKGAVNTQLFRHFQYVTPLGRKVSKSYKGIFISYKSKHNQHAIMNRL